MYVDVGIMRLLVDINDSGVTEAELDYLAEYD